jgi:hypothetical protein
MPTIHQELSEKWQELAKQNHDYRLAVFDAANRLAENFREYIGAPESYEDLRGARQRTTKLMTYVVDEQSGEYTPHHANHPLEALTRDEDGYYRFGLALAISPSFLLRERVSL